jgi:phosphate transport system substrate-binding protein
LKRITSTELRDILTGHTTHWKSLGGRDSPIRPGWATQGGGAVELLLDHLKFRRDQIGPHTSVANGAEAVRFVAGEPQGIALASVADAERAIKAGAPLKVVSYNGVTPSSRTVQNHTYALSRPLLLVTRDVPTGMRKLFIDYAVSDQIVDLQVKYGFVPYRE